MQAVVIVFLGVYVFSNLLILVFCAYRFYLALSMVFNKNSKNTFPSTSNSLTNFTQKVTIQIPVFNELYVIERIIDKVLALDYPAELLQVQILDDSTDETSNIISQKIANYTGKIELQHILRSQNIGYKAGALAAAMPQVNGEFIAIFDADFVPEADFITTTLPYFQNPNMGMVQCAWAHLNSDFNAITATQAFGLDAHFNVEQPAREAIGTYISFNGTAGIWRKSCIEAAGGWHTDTLTEDLDLSLRAQLIGWEMTYLPHYKIAAELPVNISAVKSQQYRWTKGNAETAKKLIIKVLAANISFKNKINGLLHLSSPMIYAGLFISAILSVPALYIKQSFPSFRLLFILLSFNALSTLFIGFFYYISQKKSNQPNLIRFTGHYLRFITVCSGMSYHNFKALCSGMWGLKTPFVRTPKFNLSSKNFPKKQYLSYITHKIPSSTFIEFALCLYFGFGIYYGIIIKDYGLLPFHVLMCVGCGFVFWHSIKNTVE